MKTLRLLSLVGITSIAMAQAGWAAAHGGGGGFGGGGFGGGGFGGGHPSGGGAASRGGGVGFGRPAFSSRSPFFYSRGMHYTAPGARTSRFTVQTSHNPAAS